MQSRSIAARAGRWSARRRKTAIFGWLAFVAVAVLLGGVAGTKTIANETRARVSPGRANRTLRAAFPQAAEARVVVDDHDAGRHRRNCGGGAARRLYG